MSESERLFSRAKARIPAGVNSPVRAFGSVGGTPRYIVRGEGPFIWDADGVRYRDFCSSWGPLILGHAHPRVLQAVQAAAANGLSFGACTPDEVVLAELLHALIPELEKSRLVTSGTEATMTAIRLCRAFTSRPKIVKCAGGYHGHADPFLIAAGSGLLTSGIPSSAGVTEAVAADTCVVPFNDFSAVSALFEAHPGDIACVILEPVPGNMGLVLPEPGYLEKVIECAHSHGALVIFDEVINGFRFGPSSYAHLHHLRPDLLTLGKIIGGGLPVAALGGRAELMDLLAPLGPVYQAGTLSGNPVALASGIATLRTLAESDYTVLFDRARALADGLNQRLKAHCIPGHAVSAGALLTLFFTEKLPPLRNLADVQTCDTARFARYFHGMLARGIYLPPSQFEAVFVSFAHDDAALEAFLSAADSVFSEPGF